MSLNRESKEAVVAGVVKTLSAAQTVVVAEYQGVTVSKMTTIRANARKSDVYLHVLKNTLARKAVEGTKFAPLADKLFGPLLYSVSTDPIAAARVISDFAKDNAQVKIVAGMYNEQLLDVSGIKHLASIPSREELLAKIMGVMQQIPASFVRCVAAIQAKKAEAA